MHTPRVKNSTEQSCKPNFKNHINIAFKYREARPGACLVGQSFETLKFQEGSSSRVVVQISTPLDTQFLSPLVLKK